MDAFTGNRDKDFNMSFGELQFNPQNIKFRVNAWIQGKNVA
jgi:hypothetical protein